MKKELGIVKILESYEKKPVIRGLIQLIPFGIGSGIDVALTTQLDNIRNERAKEFFDELSSGDVELTPELLESEDFLHCYFTTTKLALNSRRREKIRMFARLLKSATGEANFSSTDEYEDYLNILDELSYRELTILFKLHKYESEYFLKEGENDLQRATRFWDMFTKELTGQVGIPELEVDALLTRLNRTGCYETFVGSYWDYTGGKGKLTPTFYRLIELIKGNDLHTA
jgi:hypothetical protein